MNELDIRILPALQDNYIYVLHDKRGWTGVIDPSESLPVLKLLQREKWDLHVIINTHHHWDHTGGNEKLKALTGCRVVGARKDRHRIPGIDWEVEEGKAELFGSHAVSIIDIPGHTRGHIAYWFKDQSALFSGDTLFSMGCGRVFEGTYEELFESLKKLSKLPSDTRIFCGHEYTLTNLRFALKQEEHPELTLKYEKVKRVCEMGMPSVPSTLEEEKNLNPFLRAQSLSEFEKLRRAKDNFI